MKITSERRQGSFSLIRITIFYLRRVSPGKLWPQAKEIAEEVNLLPNLKSIVDAARQSGVRIFFVPHHRWEPGDYIHWKHATPRQLAGAKNQIFAKGTWGGEWHPDFVSQEGDIIIKEHWAQSGFANTDLDQQLKQHGIEKIILTTRPRFHRWRRSRGRRWDRLARQPRERALW
jgi:isochorismatase family protein